MTEINFSTSLQYIKNVGPTRAKVLSEIGLECSEDLLYYFPRRHLDRTTVTAISLLKKDMVTTIVGKVETCGERKTRKGKLFQAVLSDGTGFLTLLWFNGVPYIKKSIKIGDQFAVHGKIEFYNGLQIVHPEYDKLNIDDDPLNTGSVIPLYPLTQELQKAGIENRFFRKIIRRMLKEINNIPDFFPLKFLQKHKLVSRYEALHWIHFADKEKDVKRAIYRLKFDEHFFLQLLMALKKESNSRVGTKPLNKTGPHIKLIYDQLNFELTDAQNRVLKEIRTDLGKPITMNRLLQGDVGSGKTIVAVLAAAIAIGNNVQIAVMAPTEILVRQHYESFKKFSEIGKITCAILVGNTKEGERKKVIDALKTGRIDLIVGTHALIQKDIEFKNLGLVIVDEQHRFGVVQRGDLVEKGLNPHFLAMTATPIPRTLAVTYHGDMDLSIIDELPKHRKPVITKKIGPERLKNVYNFMNNEVSKGRQCMIVYPLVEETEKSDLAAAVEAYETLSRTAFTNVNVGLIHGRMKKEEKDNIMNEFSDNRIQILVSTTVIEVGIDVPNATVMLVEHADRFGLIQLHQLRGRVGRGSEKSYCIFVQRDITENSRKRLDIMERTNDGFVISDEDLKLRGPGEFFGIRQSGFFKYKIADLVMDGPIIKSARKAAFNMVAKDPHLRNRSFIELRRHFLKKYQHMLDFVNIS
ncbi:MAG TPA: DNA helicase RecG [Candidatus Marinimicrobia bacterium]|nr:DNA helicase RecG [Candidatus Neomarinimicrobiota bacterium]